MSDIPLPQPGDLVSKFEIELTPETVAFYKEAARIANDPRIKTQDLLIQIDQEITEINDQGILTSDITYFLDELWDHLAAQGATVPVSEERLKEIREQRTR